MKIHHADPRENAKRVQAVRRALGEGIRMMVDVNQRLDVLGNIRQAKALEDLDLLWYEEPVLADDIAACAEVAHAINIPVATGENNYTRFEFRDLVERRAARYLMPDVCRANGFSETMRIGRHAAAHRSRLRPRRARAVTPGRRRSAERFSRRVHRLDATRSVRADAAVLRGLFPHSRAARARYGARSRGEGEVPKRLTL